MSRHFPLYLIVLLFAIACNRTSVKLSETNAKKEVPVLGNLHFRFSKSLVPDSMLNKWDSTQYISFKPAIEGKFRWEHPDELVFSPAKPLLAATSYEAEIEKLVLKNSELDKLEAEEIAFRTADLYLQDANSFWTLAEGSNTAQAQMDVYFNYPVAPETIREKLKLKVEGAATNFELVSLSEGNKMSIRLTNLKPEDKDYNCELILEKGAKPAGGNNGTAETVSIDANLSSPFVLQIEEATAEHDGTNGSIFVKTSQTLQPDKLAQFVKLSPAVSYNTEMTEDGFVLKSAQFDPTNTYSLQITPGLKGRLGGVLKESYQSSLAFGDLEPSLGFASAKGVYLGAEGAKNIELRITNIAKVKVIVSKIYESNILAAQRYGYYPSESNDNNEDEYYYEGDGGNATFGDVIFEKEIDTRSLPKYGAGRLFQFNLADRVSDFKGIYHVKIRSTENYWISDSRFVSLSDIGLIAREAQDKLLVFANSIKKATAQEGLNVSVYGANNQLLGTGVSNAEGVAEIAYTRKEFKGFKPAMVIAKSADDFNYLPFQSTQVQTSRFDVGGKQLNSTGIDAFVYAERDMYRPGEKMNFSVVMRDYQFKSPGEIPIVFRMLMPNGKELVSFRKNLNEQGGAEAQVSLAETAITGTYLLEVFNGNSVLLASKNFKVETFMPDRIRVTTKLDKPALGIGSTANLQIKAASYFGPAAANRKYECEIQVKQKNFVAEKYEAYQFNLENQQSFLDKTLRQGQTNELGEASESFTVPELYKNAGLLQARFFATVFDETGRPVSRSETADIFTQAVFFGVRNSGSYYYPLNQAVSFPLIALNTAKQPISAQASVQIIKREYRTVLSKSGSMFRYQSQVDNKVLVAQTLQISGEKSSFSFTPRSPGDYELRVSVPGGNTYISQRFYSYGSWGGNNESFEVNTEGHIDIELDKKEYNKGDKVKALFKAPFNGKMLVTLETDKVVSYQYLEVQNRTASYDFSLAETHLPNVYITATLLKPHEMSTIPLTTAHGYKNIMVQDADKRMQVSIDNPEKIRSGGKQKITVKAQAGAMVTLAAVDAGVLAVSNFRAPDPFEHFYAKRALGVLGYNLYPLLFPELRNRLSSTGGDADLQMNLRQNPIANKRVKLMSYWSGIQKAGGSGNVSFEVDIPAFNGEIRLMAVAYKEDRFGAAESKMVVADPIVLSTALPRFLSPGDSVIVPITMSNTTQKRAEIQAVLTTAGPIKLVGPANMQSSIEAGGEQVLLYKLVAAPQSGNVAIGEGKVTVDVKGLGEKFTEVIELAVRPPSTLQKMTGAGSIAGNKKQAIGINLSDFMPAGLDYNLVVGSSPVIQLSTPLQYLLQYPHGCTEQVISAAFPQLYYADLAASLQSGTGLQNASVKNVLTAIQKIKMRQLYNGALLLWDNESTESWWTTAYAVHFLWEAKKAGYQIENTLLQPMLNYLSNRLQQKTLINYTYNRDQQKKIAPKEVAYSLYVLALAGRPNVSAMNYYKANPQVLALDSRYILSASFALAGDRKKFKEMLPTSFAGEEGFTETGGSFSSPIRDEALALNLLLEADPANGQIPLMAKHVVDKLMARSWFSTQEASFSLLALGKMARKANENKSTADITANGKKVGGFTGKPLTLKAAQLGSPNVQVQVNGAEPLYYWWQSRGVSASGAYKQEDSYLKVRRAFYDRNGRLLTQTNFKQNDLIVVKVTLDKAFSGNIENLVVTDLLPAGFEIENSRIREVPDMEWAKDASEPDQLDIRDDRIHFYTNLSGGGKVFYYTVRAVSPGTFRMGPVSADAMYNGEYHSYWGAGTVVIER